MTCSLPKLGTVCFIEQSTNRSLQWADPKSFAATGDGDATGNTVVSTVLAGISSTDDEFVGNFILGVDCENTQNNGKTVRVLEYDDLTGTITCDRFPAQTKTGDTFYMMTRPDPIFAEDTGSASDGIQDGDRDEADDFWNGTAQEGGPYIEAIQATNVSESSLYLVTDFVSSTGKASATLGAATAVGDYYELWMHPEIMNGGMIECTRNQVPREAYQGTFDKPADEAGTKDASGALELAIRGPGRSRDGNQAELHRFLKTIFTPYADAGNLTVNGAGSTVSIPYDAGTAVVGRMYVTAEGDAFMCTSAGTPCVPSPALQSVAQDDTTVTGLLTYHFSEQANYHLAAKQYRGKGIIEYIFGILPDFEFSGELNQFPKATMNVMGSDWVRIYQDDAGAISRAWEPKRPTVAPVRLSNQVVKLNGTTYGVKSWTFNLGCDRQRITNTSAPNESDGMCLVGYDPRGQIILYIVDSTVKALMDDFIASVEKEMLIQVNGTPGYPGVFAIWAKQINLTGYTFQDDAGQYTVTLDYKVDWHSDTTLPKFAIGIG